MGLTDCRGREHGGQCQHGEQYSSNVPVVMEPLLDPVE